MKKFSCLFLSLLLLLALLSGCGGSAKSDSAVMNETITASGSTSASKDYGYAYDSAPVEEMKAEVTEDAAAVIVPKPESEAGGSNPALANAKLIYTANIGLQTTEFDAAVEKMEALVKSMGGYFEHSNVDNYSSYRCGSYTIRVPAESFEPFCEQVGELCQVNYLSRSAKDISESYYDTESRLVTQRTKLERLQELLSKAESMEDIITLESAISETEWMIEDLTGTLRHYDSLVGFSTINLSIDEVYKLEDVEQPVIGFGAKLVDAFQRGCRSFTRDLENIALSFAYNWVGWLIFFIIAAVVITVVLRRVRVRRRERRRLEEMRSAAVKDKSDN